MTAPKPSLWGCIGHIGLKACGAHALDGFTEFRWVSDWAGERVHWIRTCACAELYGCLYIQAHATEECHQEKECSRERLN